MNARAAREAVLGCALPVSLALRASRHVAAPPETLALRASRNVAAVYRLARAARVAQLWGLNGPRGPGCGIPPGLSASRCARSEFPPAGPCTVDVVAAIFDLMADFRASSPEIRCYRPDEGFGRRCRPRPGKGDERWNG